MRPLFLASVALLWTPAMAGAASVTIQPHMTALAVSEADCQLHGTLCALPDIAGVAGPVLDVFSYLYDTRAISDALATRVFRLDVGDGAVVAPLTQLMGL